MYDHKIAIDHCSQGLYAGHFTKTEIRSPQSHESPYYFDFIRHFEALSLSSQKLLISDIAESYHESITGVKFTNFIEEELYNKTALSIKLIIVRDSKTDKTIGFSAGSVHQIYCLPNNFTLPNCYIVTSGIACINPGYRNQKIVLEIGNMLHPLVRQEYPNNNIIHFDVALHPASYYISTKRTELVLPNGKQRLAKRLLSLLSRLCRFSTFSLFMKIFLLLLK